MDLFKPNYDNDTGQKKKITVPLYSVSENAVLFKFFVT